MEAHFDPVVSTRLAKHFASLHVPGKPVLVTNIWDPPSLKVALSVPHTVAIATASYAIAQVNGVEDEELDLETNLSAIRLIRKTMLKSSAATDVPLSVDSQDGYGDSLASYIRSIIRLGVVGINLEDVARSTSNTSENIVETLISPEKAAVRVRTVLEVAKEMGVDGFVVNARTDCVKLGGTIEEAIHRGKLFLEAGATTVFVWGGPARGLRDAEIRELVDSLGGKVAVIHKRVDGYLGVKEIANLGVARISMGPGLWNEGMANVRKAMESTLESYIK